MLCIETLEAQVVCLVEMFAQGCYIVLNGFNDITPLFKVQSTSRQETASKQQSMKCCER